MKTLKPKNSARSAIAAKMTDITHFLTIFTMIAVLFAGQTVPVRAATDCAVQGDIPQAECEALIDLYTSTNGASWTDSPGNDWNQDDSPCSWTGVTCSLGTSGNVTQIARMSEKLIGTIPDLSALISLQKIYLGDNQLTGSIPNLSSLTDLTYISIWDNQLTGSIPDLSNLTNLETLDLSSNQLTGAVPNLSALTTLTQIILANNQLTGSIPNLNPSVIDLRLHNNQLSGTIPTLSTLTSLDILKLKNNQLSGTIPALPPSLTDTDLGCNAFTAETGGTATTEDSDWKATQTVPPTAGLSTILLSDTQIQVNWTPIAYQTDDGYYEVRYGTSVGGPYGTSAGVTADKTVGTLTVTSLIPATTYYFVVETYTPLHGSQQNNLTSIPSAEISATTMTSGACFSSITVTNSNDSGAGSLRQAIADICLGGQIRFSTDYTVNLSSQLNISKDLIIDGTDKNITLDGGNAIRIFEITTGNVTLGNLLVTNGNTAGSSGDNGGGINHTGSGTLILADMIIDNNQAAQDGGGLYNAGGIVDIRGGSFSNNTATSGNGGGIRNDGTLILSGGAVENNTGAAGGAGIDSDGAGSTEITKSSIRFNNGSGIAHGVSNALTLSGSTVNDNTGAGIDSSGTLNISNTTVYANDTGILKRDNIRTGTLNNVTIANNTTGISIEGPSTDLTVRNSIVADNGTNCGSVASVTSAGYNLENTNSCTTFINTGDMQNTSPLLDAFQNNGGPTKTMALSVGSPAIDAGDNATCMSTDQRGLARPLGAACDIGAVEMLPPCPSGSIVYVDSAATGANDGSDWTNAFNGLQTALSPIYLNNCPGVTEIHVAQGTYTPGASRSDTFQLKNNLAVYGGYPNGGGTRDWETNTTTLSGDIGTGGDSSDNSYHVVSSDSSADNTALLDGFTVSDGYAEGDSGGGIFNNGGSPTLNKLIITNNQADIFGGGIIIKNFGSPILTDILIENNIANSSGGGLASKASTPTLQNVIIRGNYAGLNGGGINNTGGGNISMSNVLISGNQAFSKGGGMSNKYSTATLTNVTVAGNHAPVKGGGIRSIATSTALVLNNVIIWGNTTDEPGSESFVENETGTHIVSYSIIQGSGVANWWTTNRITDNGNNIDLDPLFVTAVPATPGVGGDLHLQTGSPAINAGTNIGCPATDLGGLVRPQNCACDMGAYELQSPEIQVLDGATDIPDNTGAANLGATILGTPVVRTFTVKNTGAGDNLSLSNLTVPSGFSIVSSFGASEVAAGGSTTFQIRMNAGAAGTQSGTLQFDTNDYCDENPFDFTVSGTVTAPEMDIRQGTADIASGDTYDFGSVTVGEDNAKTFTVRNTGTANLNLTGTPKVQFSGSADFILNDATNSPVAPSGNTTFTVTFTPSSAGAKTASLSIPSNDSDENPYTVTLNGTGTNTPPVAADDTSYSTDEDTVLNIAAPGLLSNDTDVNGDALAAIKAGDPAHGSVTLNADGSFSYTPEADYNGTDSFTYKASDGMADSNIATVEITINAVNDAPAIIGQTTLITAEETGLTIELSHLTVTDPDNVYPDDFTLTVLDGSDYIWSGNTVIPNTDIIGTLTVTVRISDGEAESDVFSLSVTVTEVNDAPVIAGQTSLSTPEETPLTVTLNHLTVTDPDNAFPDDFTLTVQDGANYTRSGNTVTPDTDFNGNLTVPVKVSDGPAESPLFHLTVNVTPVNDAPMLDNSGKMNLSDVVDDDTEPPGNTVRQITDSSAANSGDAITDTDPDALEGIAVISVSDTNGTWQHRVGDESWRDISSAEVSEKSALLLRAGDFIRFVPDTGYHGTDTGNITFCAWDQTSGTAGENADASVRGDTTAFSLRDETASVIVVLMTDISGKINYFSNENPVSDVVLTLEGEDAPSRTALTDEDGDYTLSGILHGDYELFPSKAGDPGRDGLSGEDASKIARHAVGDYEFDDYQMRVADVNQNGRVTILDASDLARYQVGLIPKMNEAGNHWIFNPGVLTYSDPDSDREDQNFVAMRLGDVSGSYSSNQLRKSLKNSSFKKMVSSDVVPGDKLSLPVVLNGGSEIEGIDIRIVYDSEMLEVTDVTLTGGILEYEDYHLVANPAGISLILFAASEPLFTGDGTILIISFDIVGAKRDSVIEFTTFQCNESPVSDENKAYRSPGTLSGGFYLGDTVSQRIILTMEAEYLPKEEPISQYDLNGDGRVGLEDAVHALRLEILESAIRVLQCVTGK